jgi:hypothetical protein
MRRIDLVKQQKHKTTKYKKLFSARTSPSPNHYSWGDGTHGNGKHEEQGKKQDGHLILRRW